MRPAWVGGLHPPYGALIARHVFPRFQGQHHATMQAAERADAARPALAETHVRAVEAARERYAAEASARG